LIPEGMDKSSDEEEIKDAENKDDEEENLIKEKKKLVVKPKYEMKPIIRLLQTLDVSESNSEKAVSEKH
jgi:hypothetical protein